MVISLIIFIVFLIVKMDFTDNFLRSILFLLFFIVLTASFGNFLYYFEFNKQSIIVKNYLYFWFRKEYKIEKIKEIGIEMPPGRAPDGLRIILFNYKSHLYLAGTFLEKHWKEIENIANSYGIKFRNYNE